MNPWIVLLAVALLALPKYITGLVGAICDHRSPPPLDYLYPDRAKWVSQLRRRAIVAWSVGLALDLAVAAVATWQLRGAP